VRVLADEVYCSRSCQLRDLSLRVLQPVLSRLRRTVAPQWSIAVISAAAALLLTSVTLKVTELLQQETSSTAMLVSPRAPRPQPTPVLQLLKNGRRWRVEASGAPGDRFVVTTLDDSPLTIMQLDEDGNASVADLKLSGSHPGVKLLRIDDAGAIASTTMTTSAEKRTAAAASVSPTAVPVATGRVADASIRRAAPPSLLLVADAGPRLALTFDGGSSSQGTADLLDMLKRLNLKATLFLTGEFIERDAALVRRAVAEGHEVGNHTYSHPRLTTYARNHKHQLLPHVTRAWFREELQKPERAFYQATGRRMAPLWRAPYGEENSSLRGWAWELGYLHVRWSSVRGASLDSRDWVESEHSSLYQDSSRMMKRLLSFPRLEGGIVLMHLASARPQPPWQALPHLVSELHKRNIELVTVTELLRTSPTWHQKLVKAGEIQRETWAKSQPQTQGSLLFTQLDPSSSSTAPPGQ